MRNLILAAMLGLGPAAAMADDVPGDASTRANIDEGPAWTSGVFEATGDADWYRVYLRAGYEVAVAASAGDDDEGLDFALRGQDGSVIEGSFASGISSGIEFRPDHDGWFYVSAAEHSFGDSTPEFPKGYGLDVMADCLGGPSTSCRLAPGKPQGRRWAFAGDDDWYAVRLAGGERYVATVHTGAPYALSVRDERGRVVADAGQLKGWGSLAFSLPRSCVCYVDVASTGEGSVGTYEVGIARPAARRR